MKTKNAVDYKDKYNFIAPIYDLLTALLLGRKFQKSNWQFLDIIQPGDTVWVIGGGTGANLPDILKKCGKKGKVIYMEASTKMLEKAKKRIPLDSKNQVKFICADDFKLSKKDKIDVVITQFLLDVLTDHSINTLFEKIGHNASRSTRWLCLDFYPVKNKILLIRLMITGFSLLAKHPRKELPDYDYFFQNWGWQEIKTTLFEKGFYKAKVYKLAPWPIKSDIISLK